MRIDGPHRVFIALAGLWLLLGPRLVESWQRPGFIRSLIGWTLWEFLFSGSDNARTLAFFAVPIAFLYGVGWAGRKVVAWIAAGFDQRANSGLVDPGRHQ